MHGYITIYEWRNASHRIFNFIKISYWLTFACSVQYLGYQCEFKSLIRRHPLQSLKKTLQTTTHTCGSNWPPFNNHPPKFTGYQLRESWMIFFTHWAPRIVTALAGLFTNQVLQQNHSGIWVTVSKTFQADKFDKAGLSIKSTKLAIFSYWKQGIHPLFRLLFLKIWIFAPIAMKEDQSVWPSMT